MTTQTMTTQTLSKRQKEAVPQGIATKQIFAARAENAELWDVEGKRYIDFAAGIAVLNTGHRHPRIIAAVKEQAESFTHTCFHVAPYESYISLAERLNALTPGDHPKKTMFVTTGAEAVENAVKIARAHTGRPAVIAFGGAFHGRTLLGMALTGKVAPYKKGFGPFPADVYHVPYPKTYHGVGTAEALRGLNQLFQSDVDPARVAAIVVEPVQGEGGFYPAPADFLAALRALCDEYGILLVADEIQTGIARTGRMFAVDHAGVVPDLVTMAKGLGGGFPLAAVTGRAEVMDAAHPGGLGGTYGGSPIGIAAAHAVLDVIEDEKLCERAERIGAMMRERLTAMARRNSFNAIGDVRGLGAMVAFELVKDRTTREPDTALAGRLVAKAQEKGLILLTCGPDGNIIRLLAPLTIPQEQVSEGLDILEEALAEAVGA
ncbi:4-aminobutyrate aminotransferase/4-aminobutyrate aminotransferase/(S)-3-amino-2-methylpropionate transaminase [Chelatococcus caeni]|uniref:4-aminobutyrate aminotransferase/4-aminobutyrate aminotransferase/(S)-3-amino-2-methylpropionate transaminase n=2 Tax=Chelatococcus caeni TaxID=1348468 RepID=A0A840C217_9HYPH|nr:4-aminobutyrate aminotransferase/4-aminobutyrate aminotransferase/(S)-3-amino-2-methylpropionate transaminase [Chelatococcus caeni]